jgi:hypothetical protein
MQLTRRAVASDRPLFGRGRQFELEPLSPASTPGLSADVRLFVTTFLAGFIFVSVLIA